MGAKDKTKRKEDTGKGAAINKGEVSPLDRMKWICSIVVVCLAVWFDNHLWGPISKAIEHHAYSSSTIFYYSAGRVAAWLLFVVLIALVLFSTAQGKSALTKLGKARDEMYRVTWPTRQEAMKMTLVLVCIVCVVGLFLFAIDLGFMKLINMALPQ